MAQKAPQTRLSAEEASDQSRDLYSVVDLPENCSLTEDQDISNEIIICRTKTDDREFRLRSDEQVTRDFAEMTMDAGDPRAPDFEPPPCVPSLLTLCVIPGGGKAKPQMPDIDFSSIPEPVAEPKL